MLQRVQKAQSGITNLMKNLQAYPSLGVPINLRFPILPEADQDEIMRLISQPLDDAGYARVVELLEGHHADRAV